ncbi:MAG TPA: NAD(+)/NADH kinase [Candidatus Paceibacterota bacterium]|nr:NAD(+)/NADH kinase [Candidatus Paceibacterota bacterium]
MQPPKSVTFFRRPGHGPSERWESKLRKLAAQRHPDIAVVRNNADVAFVLGGDGTIMEAARAGVARVIVGLNLGTVGFLATVRTERRFLAGVRAVLRGDYHAQDRLMLRVAVQRGGATVLQETALNEVYIQSPLGMVILDVRIGRTHVQHIRGSGALIASPTGSTGYNLSAHGPIVDPSLNVFIVSEILDHNTPTPSIIIPTDRTVTVSVASFRRRGLLKLEKDDADVICSADGAFAFALREKDLVRVSRSPRSVAIAQLESDYFYQSLHEKFSIT